MYTHRMKHLTAEKAAVALASSLTHTLSLITLNQTSSVTRESLRSRGGGWGVGGESGGGGQLGGEALECLPRLIFSKVSCMVSLYRIFRTELTCEKFRQCAILGVCAARNVFEFQLLSYAGTS